MRQADSSPAQGAMFLRTSGPLKFADDVLTVAEIEVLIMARAWYWYLVGALAFPLPIFYLTHSLAPDDLEVVRRIVAGTLVFGASFTTANMVGQQISAERFTGKLKLLITLPVYKLAYVFGTLIFSSLMGAGSVTALLAFALLSGVELDLTWTLLPTIVLAILSLAGLTLFITSLAPSLNVGSIMANLLGIILVLISPVYFTMDQAPMLLRWLGFVSPMRYAADGIATSLSGGTNVWVELAALAAFSVATMSLGLWKLPWREK